MRKAITLLLLAVSAGPAVASGGLSCSAEDEAVTLEVDAGMSRGMGGALFSLSGSAAIRDDSVRADLRETEFDLAHRAQYWFDGAGLKLLLYRETGDDAAHGYVTVRIDAARSDEEGGFAGDYLVSVYDVEKEDGGGARFSGAVSCVVE